MGGCAGSSSKHGTVIRRESKIEIEINPQEVETGRKEKDEKNELQKVKLRLSQRQDLNYSISIKEYLDSAARCRQVGQFHNEITFLQQAIKVYDQNKLQKKIDYIGLHNNIGVAYGKLGKYKKATNKFIQALEIYYKNMGLELHQMLSIIQTNLAINSAKIQQQQLSRSMISQRQSKLQPQKQLSMSQAPMKSHRQSSAGIFEDVLKLSKELNGQNSSITAKIYQNIGNNYLMNAKYQLALAAFEKALQIKKNVFGDLNSEIILPKISIAHCNCKLSKYQNGLSQYRSIFILLLSLDQDLERQRNILLSNLQGDIKAMIEKEEIDKKIIESSLKIIRKNNLNQLPQWKQTIQKLKMKIV